MGVYPLSTLVVVLVAAGQDGIVQAVVGAILAVAAVPGKALGRKVINTISVGVVAALTRGQILLVL
jgi:hypothetical protein